MKHTVKIRTIIFSSVIFIFLAIILLESIQYYYISKLAVSATEDKFSYISKVIKNKITSLEKSIYDFLEFAIEYPGITKNTSLSPDNSIIHFFLNLLKKNNDTNAIYIGYPNGNFFEIINSKLRNNVKNKLNVPENTKWIIVEISKKDNIKKVFCLDEYLKIIKNISKPVNYDPRTRIWYKKAIKTNNTITTGAYIYSGIKEMGTTYAKQIKNTKVVIGIDFSIKSISNILNKEKFHKKSDIFILDKNGIIKVSTLPRNFKSIDKQILNKFSDMGTIEQVKINKIKYLFSINRLNHGLLLGISIPYTVMMKEYYNILATSIIIAILILFITIPVAFLFLRKISTHAKSLMIQNQLVAERKFNEIKPIDSKIEEFNDLSLSISNMAKDIKTFQKSLEDLFNAFVKMIAEAIDIKSKYTGNHCKRVPEIALLLAKKLDKSDYGSLKDFKISSQNYLKEIEIAAWLHDCGKLTTPEFVVDKATKLETIYNRIHEIRTRFEVLWRDIDIEGLKKKIKGEDENTVDTWVKTEKEKLKNDFEFVARCNIGDNFVSDEDRLRLVKISKKTWVRNFDKSLGLSKDEKSRLIANSSNKDSIEKLLDDKPEHIIPRTKFNEKEYKEKGFTLKVPENLYNLGEIYNLSISRGTLTEEERYKINEHIIASIQMLESLPFPEELKNVPEFAGGHHEHVSGKGYPRNLTKEDMSVPARILAIADIFESLTATDRPYKKAKKLSETIEILMFMAKNGHIDHEIFNIFLKEKVYLEYAKKYLQPELIDDINIEDFLVE